MKRALTGGYLFTR